MANNRATKYVFHSEKTKTTCDECKKHDKEVYYDIKDIPTLPIHPNCKCWIEVVELKNINNNTKCNCADTFKVLENNLNNSIENINSMLNNIKDNLFNIEEEINNNNNSNNKTNKEKENIINKFYLIQNKIKEFKNECENLLTDIQITKEYTFDNTFHTIEQCKSKEQLNKLSKHVSSLCKNLDNLSEELKQIKEEKKTLIKNIKEEEEKKEKEEKELKELKKGNETGGAANLKINKKQKTIKETPVTDEEKTYYNLANSFGKIMPVADACLQDALHDFKMTKKNPNAVILNSRDEIKNKDINKVLDNYKVPKNSKGVYYDINSKESNKIARSNAIQEFISENYEKIINNTTPIENNIDFEEQNDKDLYYALHGCKLLNPKMTNDGYFMATVVDYYDFKYNKGDSLGIKINNWGYAMQKKGILENYYVIFSIKFKYGNIKQ